MSEERFEIVPERMDERYSLANYDAIEGACKAYIARKSLPGEIESRDDYRFAKDSKADCTRMAKDIAKKRLDINDILLGEYNARLKSLEQMLKANAEDLKGKIESYEQSEFGKEPRQRIIALEVRGFDQEAIKKVEDLATSLKLTVKYKKEN